MSAAEQQRALTPPESPLTMPTQELRRAPKARFAPTPPRVWAARCVAFGGAAALTVYGARQMTLAFDAATATPLQFALRFLFVLTFAWVALSACSALAGVLFPPRRSERSAPAPASTGRVALVMPIYHEDVAACFGALGAMAKGLAALRGADRFEVFVLSDSRDPDSIARELSALSCLRDAARAEGWDGVPIWWRRRGENGGKKAGNLREFVERWGARYDHMVVLDADSLMAPETIVELVRRIDADAALALLQTTPRLIGGRTPFARLQQVAASLYGATIARGVAAWQGDDGNFWGHNAVIRVRAFAAAAGLPELPGRRPFGGAILSHDFVEAALLRRAGWAVRMDPDLGGSWEGAPPSLLAAAARDRRWAQGNLQHLGVIGAAGLRWPSRAHFGIGVASYAASAVWLALLAVGVALTVQAGFARPDYFPQVGQLFPTWPRFDAERLLALLGMSTALLLAPKVIGLAMALKNRAVRRGHGGAAGALGSFALELAASSLVAPVMMLMQVRALREILSGRDGGWEAQDRAGDRLSWAGALRAHRAHAALGLTIATAIAVVGDPALLWLTPVAAGLSLAPWSSRASGDAALGRGLRRAGWLRIAEETAPPQVAMEAEALAQRLRDAMATDFDGLVASAGARVAHARLLAVRADGTSVAPLDRLTARAKLAAATSLVEAGAWLTDAEKRAVLMDATLFAALPTGGARYECCVA